MIAEDVEAVAGRKGVGVNGLETGRVIELSGFPVLEGGREIVIADRGEGFEERGGTEKYLREDLRKVREGRNVSYEPKEISIEEHHFSSVLV